MFTGMTGDRARSALEGSRFADVRWVAETGSTNADLLAAARSGEPDGVVLVADHQTAGRGRLGRTWVAPPGGSLLFSVLLRPALEPGHLHLLTTALGVAAAGAVDRVAGVTAGVKWPNDLLVEGRKLGGILIETSGEMQGPSVAVIGVGVNHRLGELAAGIGQPATDVASHCNPAPSRNLILARTLVHLVAILDAFERGGFAPLRDEWRSLHAYQGQRVRVN